MQVNSDNPKEHKTITPTKMLITAGILCIPVITETGEVLNKTIKTHRLEKTPLKDSFIKVVEQNGNRYQSWFSSLQKHSSKKIGAIGLALEAMLDVLCVYWCVNSISKWFSKD